MPVDLVALAHAQSRQVTIEETVYTCNPHSELKVLVFVCACVYGCGCVCMWMGMCIWVCVSMWMRVWMLALTVHFVALNEIFVVLQVSGRIGNVRPDVVIQVPAEVLICHHEQQSVQIVS